VAPARKPTESASAESINVFCNTPHEGNQPSIYIDVIFEALGCHPILGQIHGRDARVWMSVDTGSIDFRADRSSHVYCNRCQGPVFLTIFAYQPVEGCILRLRLLSAAQWST